MSVKKELIMDTECYKDYWLCKFFNPENGNMRSFELFEGHPLDTVTLRKMMKKFTIISFNGNGYDMPMITLALNGANNATLKKASDFIIINQMKPWHIERQFGIKLPRDVDHIDIIEIPPGMISLKLYAGRIHAKKMQDLPIEPDASISPEERPVLDLYCGNDLINTNLIRVAIADQIDLRVKMSKLYGTDLRSKSDAQIAETVIRNGVQELTGELINKPTIPTGTVFKYLPPEYIRYQTPLMQNVLRLVSETNYVVNDSGKVNLPKAIAELDITIGNSTYRMGNGGLHSTEKSATHFAGDDHVLVDRDVTSYYPSIILGLGLYPRQMGPHFLTVYRKIVEDRIAAKARKDTVTADALKITINGSFGKFGSKWSILYAPDLLIQTTLTGQLALLMFIEDVEAHGISVVSANTDGVVMKCPKTHIAVMDACVRRWEDATGFTTEDTHYSALYSRDVNNYIAFKTDGGYKSKGEFALPNKDNFRLAKNPSNEICALAFIKYAQDRTPIEKTITECRDIRRFVSITKVTGGAVKDGELLGKSIRFYYSTNARGAIHYKTNGNKVQNSDGAMPLMELPDTLPDDINYRWYIRETYRMLRDVGTSITMLNPQYSDIL